MGAYPRSFRMAVESRRECFARRESCARASDTENERDVGAMRQARRRAKPQSSPTRATLYASQSGRLSDERGRATRRRSASCISIGHSRTGSSPLTL